MYFKKTQFIFYIFLSITSTFSAFAQKDTTIIKQENNQLSPSSSGCFNNKSHFTISCGIGYSKLWGLYSNAYLESYPSTFTMPITISPVGSVSIEYGITKKSSIGIMYSYQETVSQFYQDESPKNVFEHINKSNLDFQYLRYGNVLNRAAFYYGARIGITIWNDQVVDQRPQNQGELSIIQPSLGAASVIRVNGQFFVGIRIYILRSLSFNIETGLDTPYIVQSGLSYIL